MHNRETCSGPVAVPTVEEEKSAYFDWAQEVQVS